MPFGKKETIMSFQRAYYLRRKIKENIRCIVRDKKAKLSNMQPIWSKEIKVRVFPYAFSKSQ